MNITVSRTISLTGVLISLLVPGTTAQAVTCPDGPNKVNVTVASQVSFNAVSNLYTYAYTLSNDITSAQEINGFWLDFAPPVSNIKFPSGWLDGKFRLGSTLSWHAMQVANPDEVSADTSVPPSIVQIKPGTSLSGFSFQSPNPPGSVKYYVTGFVPMPVQVGATADDAEAMAETLAEQCPSGIILDLAVTGTTRGPVGGPGVLQFSARTYRVSEGAAPGTALLTVTRAIGSQGAVSVDLATSDGGAIAGEDYGSAAGTITFADGDAVSKNASFPIANDTLAEPDDNIWLTLSNPTGGAILGPHYIANLFIVNDDTNLQFSVPAYSVTEAAGTATIRVDRVGVTTSAVTVNYATSDGTAKAGSDYTASSGTLSFASGQISKTFSIPILDNAIVEPNEKVNLTLSAPAGGVATLGTPTTAALTIVNDDTALRFSAATYSVNEGAGAATITVTRVGSKTKAVAVNYATSDGTATMGTDYTASTGIVSFAAGDNTPKTFTVPITNDTAQESSETVNLTLSNPVGGATLATPNKAVLTIASDD